MYRRTSTCILALVLATRAVIAGDLPEAATGSRKPYLLQLVLVELSGRVITDDEVAHLPDLIATAATSSPPKFTRAVVRKLAEHGPVHATLMGWITADVAIAERVGRGFVDADGRQTMGISCMLGAFEPLPVVDVTVTDAMDRASASPSIFLPAGGGTTILGVRPRDRPAVVSVFVVTVRPTSEVPPRP